MRFMNSGRWLTACLLSLLPLAPAAHAQSEADFFRGKTVRMVVGFASGNEYDIGARLLARHLARHIPAAPTVIVQNMPQAASIVAANYVYTQAPRDGTVIGAITRNLVNQALLGQSIDAIDPQAIAELAVADTAPFDDHHASAEYRRTVGRRIFARTLGEALNIRKAA